MFTKPSTILVVSACLCAPIGLYASPVQNSNSSAATTQPIRGQREAMKMVPTRAALTETLDGDKTAVGYAFHAKLTKKTMLDNGVELPSGTMLKGTIVQDQSQIAGKSRLALRLDQATTPAGKVIPIKATIVGIVKPEETNSEDYPVSPGNQSPNSWTDQTLKFDQINVLPGVDLHSAIANSNSGVLVSNNDKDVKLGPGSELKLAIAEQRQN